MKIRIRQQKKEDFNTDVVYVKDFGDSYHRSDYDPSDELTKAALDIRRIYKKQNEYRRAVSVFNEYFAKIVDKYGGPTMFRLALASGQVTDFLPPIPKLKNKRFGTLFKKNIILSEFSMRKVDEDDIAKVIRTMDNDEPLLLADTDEQIKGIEKLEKFLAKIDTSSNPLEKSRDISVLEAYFARRHREEEEERMTAAESITLTQMLSDDFYEILAKFDTTDEDELVSYNGDLISRKQIDNIEIVKELYSLGWNTTKILNAMGSDSKLLQITKKQRKEAKKARKRSKKAESYMAKLMSDNKFTSFDQFDDAVSSSVNDSIFDRFRD